MNFQPISSVDSSKLHQRLKSTNWSLHYNQNAYKNDKTIYTPTEKNQLEKNLIGGKQEDSEQDLKNREKKKMLYQSTE